MRNTQAHQLAHPMSIPTDGSGTVLLEGERERYVVEFVDPGKRTVATVNLAGLGLDEGKGVRVSAFPADLSAVRFTCCWSSWADATGVVGFS